MSLAHYIGWGRTLGKGYGIEQGAVGNTLEEHHERTHWEPGEHDWEHDGWEHMNKKFHPQTPFPLRRKEDEPFGGYVQCLIGCMHVLFLDMVANNFFALDNTTSKKHTMPIVLYIDHLMLHSYPSP
jgi:hypothetical protein